MSSRAWKKFQENAEDLDQLFDLYAAMVTLYKSEGDPIPEGMEVLFRSAVVLMVSHWEAYIEDITSEAISHIVTKTKDSTLLPKELKKQVASELKNAINETEVWKIADDGWRPYIKARLDNFKDARNRNFNTPKAQKTEEFIKTALGMEKICRAWKTDKMTEMEARKKLDTLIEIRGQIAHRGKIDEKLDQKWVKDHVKFLRNIASITGGKINAHVRRITGTPLW
jgi:hypothetical protein